LRKLSGTAEGTPQGGSRLKLLAWSVSYSLSGARTYPPDAGQSQTCHIGYRFPETSNRPGTHRMKRLPFLAALLLAPVLIATDWPHYLGPTYNNVSSEKGLAKTWPAGGPKKLWETRIGAGFAAPSVVGNRLYVMRRVPPKAEPNVQQKDILLCLDATTGAKIWEADQTADVRKYGFPGSRTAPAVKDGRVFTIGPAGDLYAFAAEDGKLLWRHNLLKEFQSRLPNWAVGQSPLVWEDLVICTPQGQKGTLVAFDAATGKPRWTTMAGQGRSMSYSSPILATIDGVEQVLAITGSGRGTRTGGYDPKTGKKLWEYSGWQCNIPITAPLSLGDGRVFITGEYGAGSAMIKVTRNGDRFQAKELFKTQACGAQIHQPFLIGNYLYANSNGNKRHDGFVCLDLEGNRKWATERNPNFDRGSMLLADGRIYALNGNNGTLIMIDPSPEGFKQVAECKPLGGKVVWAPLVLSNGRLYIRDQEKLVCLDIRAK
jgi:outer membrane protein assembly factor BamB